MELQADEVAAALAEDWPELLVGGCEAWGRGLCSRALARDD